MITYRVPTNVAVDGVLQEYVPQTEGFLGLEWMPFKELNAQMVVWDEKDRDRGATSYHNMDADPKIGKRPGSKRHKYTPIPHKETDVINESDLLMPRQLGTLGGVIDVSTEIGEITGERARKNKLRAEIEVWQALKGQLSVHRDGVDIEETFPVQEYDVDVDWDELDTAKPLSDWMKMVLKFRFTGASAAGAEAAMNSTTAGWLLLNKNEDDLKGFQGSNFLKLAYAVEEVNKIFTARKQPLIRVYDEGYVNEADEEVLFLDDGEIIVKGARPQGQKIGDYALTPTLHRVVNGQPAPGFFSIVTVNGLPNPGAVTVQAIGAAGNPKIEVTGGMYGGPRLKYPRSIIRVNAKLT